MYVIIIIFMVCFKPSFVYDYNKMKYKEFGTTNEKTIFTLPIISVFLATFIAIFFAIYSNKKSEKKDIENVRYIPIPIYQPNFMYEQK